jgi:hypothetical protein
MPSNDFPSGPWTGFYQYNNGQKGNQDLTLSFDRGRVTGVGVDELGNFLIEGSYDDSSKEANWVKTFPNSHAIEYRGFREGSVPGIWGTWTVGPNWTGGFHIWPLSETLLDPEEEQEKQSLPKKIEILEELPAR